MNYADRAKLCQNSAAKNLLQIMADKKTNLCVSADVTQAEELLSLVESVGDEICLLKTHIDIINNFNYELIDKLLELKNKHHFLLFEDRKFADIGNTVKMQYAHGVYRIADWADIINAHIIPGPGIIEGLRQIGLNSGRGLLLIAQMSSQDNLATDAYTQKNIDWAKTNTDFVMGFIAMEKLIDEPTFITMTPGIKLKRGTDALGQQYRTPDEAIANGSDIIIVGRNICQAQNPKQAAQQYRQAAWQAYLARE